MAVETTTYRVETVYDVTDRASRALGEIERSAGRATRSATQLSTVLGGFGAVILGAGGIAKAKSAFIDFNSTIQESKAGIAGMLGLASKTSFTDNLSRADKMYASLQQRAASLPGTTQEYVTMAGMITQPIIAAGLGMKQLEDITVNTVVASKALRVEAGAAARDIDQALRGQFHSVDVFTGKLLGSIGYAGEAGRAKFNAQDIQKRASELQRAIMQPQIAQMAAAQGAGYSGVVSTLKDAIEQTLGRVGLPLFKSVTKEIAGWNKWLEHNSAKIDRIVGQVGKGLVSGFEMAKDAVKWIVDHADVLLSIGKVWAGTKIIGALGSGVAGSFNNIMSAGGGKAKDATLGGIVQVGAASYLAATEIMKLTGVMDSLHMAVDPQKAKYEKLVVSMQKWDDALEQSRRDLQGKGQTGTTATNTYANMLGSSNFIRQKMEALADANREWMTSPTARYHTNDKLSNTQRKRLEAGGFDADEIGRMRNTGTGIVGGTSMAKLQSEMIDTQQRAFVASEAATKRMNEVMSTLTKEQQSSVDLKKATQAVMEAMVRSLADGKGGINFQEVKALMLGERLGPDSFSQSKPNITNIKIDRVEVAAKDPDRWISELDAKAKRHVHAPRQARAALRGF